MPGDSGGGIDGKQAWGNLLGDENVLYLDWSGDYVGVHTCEKASNCSLQMGASCWVKVKTKQNENKWTQVWSLYSSTSFTCQKLCPERTLASLKL